MSLTQCKMRLALHGLAVELELQVPAVAAEARSLHQAFGVGDWPDGFTPVSGVVQPFVADDVLKRVSSSAVAVPQVRELVELYQDGERFWLIDERWGIAELNVLRGRWRSWVLQRPQVDTVRLTEMAVLWPMAQLLRHKDLYLMPGVAISRDGWSALILSPFGIEPELVAMIRAGYRVIGQRWVAIREEDGRIALLHMPGQVERVPGPSLRTFSRPMPLPRWIDLMDEHLGAAKNYAFCNAVLIAEPGRRPVAHVREVGHTAGMNILRRAWPIIELPTARRSQALPRKLATACKCAQLQLSRDGRDILHLLDTLRDPRRLPHPRAAATAGLENGLSLTPWGKVAV